MKDSIIFSEPYSITESSAPWTNCVKNLYDVLVYEDKYPVTIGHLLYVPKFNTRQSLEQAIKLALNHGLDQVETGTWEGFNLGLNIGGVAGQTVSWPHVHLIPREKGDCIDPTGGIRGVIPSQQNYKTDQYRVPKELINE